MVKEIRIHFEGDPALRRGFHTFLKSVVEEARQRGIGFKLIAGEATVVEDFTRAIRSHPDAINILLLDSDAPDEGNLIQVLMQRSEWQIPAGCSVKNDQIHFMVQVMESWFLADQGALQSYYGQGFRQNRLPANQNVEAISKNDVMSGLKEATSQTQKGKYHKTKHAPTLLQNIDPISVQKASPHCKHLFETLQQLISG